MTFKKLGGKTGSGFQQRSESEGYRRIRHDATPARRPFSQHVQTRETGPVARDIV
jgi:hypothetical protein